MAQNSDLLILVHNVSSISVDYSGKIPSQELRSRSLDRCKAPLKSAVLIATSMNRGDSAKLPSPKESASPEATRPPMARYDSRMKQYSRPKSKKDIRRFKHDPFVLNCNHNLCPAFADRMKRRVCADACRRIGVQSWVKQEIGINVSPTLSRLCCPISALSTDAKVVQTEITLNDFILQNEMSHTLAYVNDIPLKTAETKDTLTKKNIYKKRLETVITNWLQTVPIFYSTDFTVKYLKDNIVTIFVEKIARLQPLQASKDNYLTKIKNEIDNCLNILPMWLPNNEQNQMLFKNSIRDKLCDKILELNVTVLENDTKESDVKDKTMCEENYGISLVRRDSLYAKVINHWLSRIKLNTTVSKRHVVNLILERVSPLLNLFIQTTSSKQILIRRIVEVLNDVSVKAFHNKNMAVHCNRLAEELLNRLLIIQAKLETSSKVVLQDIAAQGTHIPIIYNNKLKLVVRETVSKALGRAHFNKIGDIEREVCNVILDSLETLRSGIENNISTEICNVLCRTNSISKEKAMQVAKKLKLRIKIALKRNKTMRKASAHSMRSQLSDVTTIYRSGEGRPITSASKKPSKKDIPRLNSQEASYVKNVIDLIRAWMETLPKVFSDDKQFIETNINDLAEDIMDEVKREQLSPESETEKEKHINNIMYRWLSRFEVFKDLNDSMPYIDDFLAKFKTIPEPQLTAPQHGTRQAMDNLRHYVKEDSWEQVFVPKGKNILEDQISVWMNEQPSEIYASNDKSKRHKIIKDLALKLQQRLKDNSPENVINEDINQWLNNVVKPEEKEHIGLLTQYLKEKMINVSQDDISAENRQKVASPTSEDKKQEVEIRNEEKNIEVDESRQNVACCISYSSLSEDVAARNASKIIQNDENRQNAASTAKSSSEVNVQEDPEQSMNEFILKYIERNYDIKDPLVRGAFGQFLKTELRKLPPSIIDNLYNNLENNEDFKPDMFKNELDYIRMISDWLKNIPVNLLYNTPGNRPRVDFVIDLAKNIQEVEDLRKQNCEGMDYDLFLSSIISISLRTYNVPILSEHKDNIPLMINQLLSKIISNRPVINHADSMSNSEITEQNFSEFIDGYIRVNCKDLADDVHKLEAWTDRLHKEVKNILKDVHNPSALTKAYIYDIFSKVPVPRKESIERFNLEMKYVDNISDWLKNFPLLPITDIASAEKERADLISELAQKISETEEKKNLDSTNNTAEKDLVEYITNWIPKLPLNPNKTIVVPEVVQQLMKMIKKNIINEPEEIIEKKNEKESGEIIENIKQKETKEILVSEPQTITIDDKASKTPGTHIVESIENWCNKLPIEATDKDEVNIMRNKIAKELYKKIEEFNVNLRIYNDDVLYENLLGDEIDTELENLPQNTELQNNSKKLKDELLGSILTMKKIVKQKSDSDNYKHKLENTIDAAIPNPVQDRQLIEPEFEIYKKHLASMFILDNFDHTDDDIKMKYEKRIRDEINKYFESAQKRNALPTTRAQMYNDLYSELFKVPMPNEESVIDEVEEVKTRCEIDAWFENLPLREANGIAEYIERDQVLSTLAKRLHHIEKTEQNPDEKIYKEISKWLRKLPLVPGEETNIDLYTSNLQNALKTSAEARKYVPAQPQDPTQEKFSHKTNTVFYTRQVAGPSSTREKLKTCEQITSTPHKRPGGLIVEIVENWCEQIPLIGDDVGNKITKEDLALKIVIKICEFNMDPNIFNDDFVYDQLFDEELEKCLSNLPTDQDFERNKPERKQTLIRMIKSVQDLIREENQKHEYVIELHNTVTNILKDHRDTPEKRIQFNKLKDEIVDNFIQFDYSKDDDDAKLIYKRNLHNAVYKYLSDVKDKGEHSDQLVKLNQLVCELSKVPAPKNKILKNIVEEIKMKQQIEHFFQENSLNDNTEKTKQIKRTLTKILNEIEKSGHNNNNDKIMNAETAKCLNKYNTKVNPDIIMKFVETLKNNESERKTPPKSKENDANISDRPKKLIDVGILPSQTVDYIGKQDVGFKSQSESQAEYLQTPPLNNNKSRCQCGQRWMSSMLITQHDAQHKCSNLEELRRNSEKVFQMPLTDQNRAPESSRLISSVSPQVSSSFCPGRRESESIFPPNDFDPNQAPLTYEELKSRPFLNSTMAAQVGAAASKRSDLNESSFRDFRSGTVRPYSPSIGPGSNNELLSYVKMATPRRVQGETSSPEPHGVTPDALFQAPIFVPRPMSSRLTILTTNPSGSSRCFRPSRATSGKSSSKYWPVTNLKISDSAERYPCICERKHKTMKGKPYCIVPMDEYCEKCGGFSSTWCKIPVHGCLYMQY